MAYTSWSVVFEEQPSVAKWNILGTNDASFNDGTGIGDGAITPEKLLSGTGTDWAWTSFVPSWTSSGTQPTLGNGTITGKYAQIGKTVIAHTQLILGNTSSAGTGSYRLSFPVTPTTPNAYQDLQPIGTAMITDSGLFNAYSYPVFRTGVSSYYELGLLDKSSGTYNWVVFNGWSATSFTHNTNDLIRTLIIYEAA